jgi:hypothetical protein
MAKQGPKAQQSADRSELATGAPAETPCFAGIGTHAIRLDHARGVPICLGAWTSFGGAAQDPTRIAIQEWSAKKRTWTVIEVIWPHRLEAIHFPPLQPETFAGKYDRERVLTVFKAPPEYPSP